VYRQPSWSEKVLMMQLGFDSLQEMEEGLGRPLDLLVDCVVNNIY
jgi:hypothetical protein